MPGEARMGIAATAVPVVIELDQATLERLLGGAGKKMLGKTLKEVKLAVGRRDWPVLRIEVLRHQDDEEDDESLLVSLALAPNGHSPMRVWRELVEDMAAITSRLEPDEAAMYRRMVNYGVSN